MRLSLELLAFAWGSESESAVRSADMLLGASHAMVAEALQIDFQTLSMQFEGLLEVSEISFDDSHRGVGTGHAEMARGNGTRKWHFREPGAEAAKSRIESSDLSYSCELMECARCAVVVGTVLP